MAIKLDDLKPAPYNPRVISETAQRGLGASIQKFGDLSGIVWNQRSGHLVTGHQRVERLKHIGARFTGNGFELGAAVFPVRTVDWDDDTEMAANVTANNQKIQGDWEDDLLKDLAEELDGYEWDGLQEAQDELLQAFADEEDKPKPLTRKPLDVAFRYVIEIECRDEDDQRKVYNQLVDEGLQCKVLRL